MGTVAQKNCPLHHPTQRWALHGKRECRTGNCLPIELPRKTETFALVTCHVCTMRFISLCKLLAPHWAAFQHAQHGHYRWALTYEVFHRWGFQVRPRKLSDLDLCKTRWFLKPKLFWEAQTSGCCKNPSSGAPECIGRKKPSKTLFCWSTYSRELSTKQGNPEKSCHEWMDGIKHTLAEWQGWEPHALAGASCTGEVVGRKN